VYFASDVSPFAMSRDKDVVEALTEAAIEPRRTPGNFIADIGKVKPYSVFTPFWRAWSQLPRREIHGAPRKVPVPSGLTVGQIPAAAETWLPGGESAGRKAMLAFDHTTYDRTRNRLDRETSLLSPYLHLGAISARELEERVGGSYARQLAWRDFYAHVLLNNPDNTKGAFQKQLDQIEWTGTDEHFDAWREGRTGFPVVDAGMRQLAATGWMHNRARLITASFLVKDLHIDWRRGERHFMELLLDGDVAQNNGNWQWISSVGVDPAPLYRRLYNPTLQAQRHDPDGAYVARWARDSRELEPIVDHQVERRRTLEAYAAARDS
jgi:deoxyribodipyrimidine photo-lyase